MTRIVKTILHPLFVLLLISAYSASAQITSPEADNFSKVTTDTAYIFCTTYERQAIGSLTAISPTGTASTFSWEKFDTLSASFIPFNGFIEFEDTLRSTISRLDDGLYRVSIVSGSLILPPYQAYVLNNWINITKAEIPDSTSNCDGFKILADYEIAPMRYWDPNSGTMKTIRNAYIPFETIWKGNGWTSPSLNPDFPPIASDSNVKFDLKITDKQFGCEDNASAEYESKIPKSGFTADPMKGEAVLKVTFTNESVNADSTLWHFYKSDSLITIAFQENNDEIPDSIDFILTDNSPVYEYEWTGKYQVNLVTVKINPTTGNCYDTLFMKKGEYIDVEYSEINAPNVFTPNGDNINDVFVVQSKSLKSMSIKIYNRWGGLVHSWSYSNIRGRDYTYEHSVWDGRIGSRMASPGVYFYVIRATGRDGRKQNKEGFFHLFREKN